MDYSKYFNRLLEKQREQKHNFPKEKVFEYRDGKYHSQAFQYENVRYNFVVSSDRSTTYGEDFNGLIVEVYINDKNYYESYFHQLKEHKEEIEDKLLTKSIVWQDKGESARGTVCRIYVKKEVDLENETKWEEYIDWQITTMIDFLKVMPKYTSKLEKKEVENMDYIELESKFKEYLNAMGHSQATLSTYPNMLNRDIPNTMNDIDDNFPNTVFKIQNIEELNSLYDRCISGDLKEFNLNTQNRAPSAAIKKYIDFLQSMEVETKNNEAAHKEIKIKNLMLYGAPGVGKTHNYRNIIAMIEEGVKTEKEIFDFIAKNEKVNLENDTFEIVKNEKRVEFITFHQSYSYEDFIEGFRPSKDNGIQLEDGIFKNICEKAINNSNKSNATEKLVFSDALDVLLNSSIENEEMVRINLKRENSYFEIYDYDEKSIFYTRQGRDRNEDYHTLAISTLKTMYNEEENNSIVGGLKTYYNPLLETLLKIGKENKVENVDKQNFYVVIDEINRGNISKIFGELITLIEEDKRDKYEITLPYSKDPFKVPSNLYIIATMNSTDKSIATIDIALRRRFTFIKMKPNEELVKDQNAKKLMHELNEYIENSLGEDYKLGHSYFMGDYIDLEFIKNYKIKPLLEEYFYADEDNYKKVIEILEE